MVQRLDVCQRDPPDLRTPAEYALDEPHSDAVGPADDEKIFRLIRLFHATRPG